MPSAPRETKISAGIASEINEEFALDVAARLFEFDPQDRKQPQSGVESLQKSLISDGFEIIPDGVLGNQTIRALLQSKEVLNRAGGSAPESGGFSFSAAEPKDTKADREPGPAAQLRAGDLSMGAIRRNQDAKRQAPTGTGADAAAQPGERQPEPQPEPQDEPAEAERREQEPAEQDATARPIALSDSAIEDVEQDRLGFPALRRGCGRLHPRRTDPRAARHRRQRALGQRQDVLHEYDRRAAAPRCRGDHRQSRYPLVQSLEVQRAGTGLGRLCRQRHTLPARQPYALAELALPASSVSAKNSPGTGTLPWRSGPSLPSPSWA